MKLRYGEGFVEAKERADGSVAYRARWRGADGRMKCKTFGTERAAGEHLLDLSTRKRRGVYADPATMTVNEALDEYLARGARRWQGGTYATYMQRTDKHIRPALGGEKIAALDTGRIQRWVDGLDRTLSPNTVASAHTVLIGALAECVRDGLLTVNPARGVRLPVASREPRPVWSAAQVKRVLTFLADTPKWYAVYLLALSTGMRPGELRALQWRDIDLDAGAVTVRRTVTKSDGGGAAIRESTKSGRSRVVALTAPCVEALTFWRMQGTPLYVFGTDLSPLRATKWDAKHRTIIARTGVNDITLHGLRHTAATLLLEKGTHPKIVADMLGHTGIRITLDIYSHVDGDMQRRAMSALDDVFNTTTPDDNG